MSNASSNGTPGNYMTKDDYLTLVIKKPRKKTEHYFEQILEHMSPLFKCAYIKIPDAIYTKDIVDARESGIKIRERRRPFDGVLITPTGVFCIEAKQGSNSLMPHQLVTYHHLMSVNKTSIYIVRMRRYKERDDYIVEQPEHNELFRTSELQEFFAWFINKLTATKK